ncbi:Heparan sulfate glucosamine 3-O-sulfotransferase 5 [Holothuria leucospilota]|uniref:Heparan sulfate glucosamine 3-O-sulfotransferase 5 n=1 Tax=Holothuria leucospilota TaxID=206669 RepID=A0A9Q1H4H7_HOLLE|nr:Heparan sulfate glucosamine 3-O-sulfotransferase 5 [Holothuria leucospilota]
MQSKLDVNANLHLKVSTQLIRPVNITSLTTGDKLWGCYYYYGNKLGASRNLAGLDVLSEINCSRRVPSAILLGVKKCGSQTLTGFLDLHPDVVSRVFPFSENTISSLMENNDAFLKAMPLSTPNEQTFIDMIEIQNDPQFLPHLTTNLNSNTTKYLLILVNPVARAQSDYVHVNVKMKLPQNSKLVKREIMSVWDKKLLHRKEPNVLFKGYRIAGTLERSVLNASGIIDKGNNLIKKGIYYDYVKEILKYVSRDRLLVVDGEQFISEPWLVLRQVEKFLGISSYFKKSFFTKIGKFYCPVFIERPDAGCLKGKGRKKKKIDQKTNKRLQRFFQPYNRKLENLLGEKLSWM